MNEKIRAGYALAFLFYILMQINMDKIISSDLFLASVLVTLGYELLELDRSNPKKIYFIFKQEKGINKDITNYWADKIKLPAQTLLNNQRALKNRVYSGA